mmetsp:Transcript_24067/g.78338  ORF Transcript_24067/g.78338 Transcript_24067/m.78338 type:complete len:366 (+) Transcript_24067:1223-2320(+)
MAPASSRMTYSNTMRSWSSSSPSMSFMRRRVTCTALEAVHATKRTAFQMRRRAPSCRLLSSSAIWSSAARASLSASFAWFRCSSIDCWSSSCVVSGGAVASHARAAATTSPFVSAGGGGRPACCAATSRRSRPRICSIRIALAAFLSKSCPSRASFSRKRSTHWRFVSCGACAPEPFAFFGFLHCETTFSAASRAAVAFCRRLMTVPVTGSRSRRALMTYFFAVSPIRSGLPTAKISSTPALANFSTSESIALLVAVAASTRAPGGMRCRNASVMKKLLPVPGGPCTMDTAPESPRSAAACPSLRRPPQLASANAAPTSGRHVEPLFSYASRPSTFPFDSFSIPGTSTSCKPRSSTCRLHSACAR